MCIFQPKVNSQKKITNILSYRSGYSRGLQHDEEDAADVLANQLSGLGPPLQPVYEVSVKTQGTPSEAPEPSQEDERVLEEVEKKEMPSKQSKKTPGKRCLQLFVIYTV